MPGNVALREHVHRRGAGRAAVLLRGRGVRGGVAAGEAAIRIRCSATARSMFTIVAGAEPR